MTSTAPVRASHEPPRDRQPYVVARRNLDVPRLPQSITIELERSYPLVVGSLHDFMHRFPCSEACRPIVHSCRARRAHLARAAEVNAKHQAQNAPHRRAADTNVSQRTRGAPTIILRSNYRPSSQLKAGEWG